MKIVIMFRMMLGSDKNTIHSFWMRSKTKESRMSKELLNNLLQISKTVFMPI
jgi:hypothetical protein